VDAGTLLFQRLALLGVDEMSEILMGRWDCDACGNCGILGDQYSCSGCGSARPEDVEFYLPSDAEVITDAKAISDAKAGADWKCEYCNSWIPATLNDCNRCGGGDVGSGERQETETYKSDSQIPRSSKDAERIAERKYEESLTRDPFTKKSEPKDRGYVVERKRGPVLPLAITTALALFFGIGGYFLLRSKDVPVVVVQHQWQRVQQIQQYQTLNESGWDHPSDAYNISTSRRIHHHEQVLDHYETRYRQESYQEQDGYRTETYTERVSNGTERYVSGYSTRNLGNGRFERVPQYSTRTIYRTVTRTRQVPRYRTKYRDVPYKEAIYRQEPIYRTFYVYQINRWQNVSPRNTGGIGINPEWPSTHLDNPGSSVGCYRLGERDETYTITVETNEEEKRSYNVKLDFSRWQELSDGESLIAKIGIGGVKTLMTLEEAERENR